MLVEVRARAHRALRRYGCDVRHTRYVRYAHHGEEGELRYTRYVRYAHHGEEGELRHTRYVRYAHRGEEGELRHTRYVRYAHHGEEGELLALHAAQLEPVEERRMAEHVTYPRQLLRQQVPRVLRVRRPRATLGGPRATLGGPRVTLYGLRTPLGGRRGGGGIVDCLIGAAVGV